MKKDKQTIIRIYSSKLFIYLSIYVAMYLKYFTRNIANYSEIVKVLYVFT